VALLVDHVHGQPVARLHQHVQVRAAGVDGHPAWVVIRRRGVNAVDECQLPRLRVLAVRPDLVGLQVGRVEICLGRVKDHAVYARVGRVLIVLDVAVEGARRGDGEDVAVTGKVVEGVAIDAVRGFLRGQDEDGTCVGVGSGGVCWSG